jgi:hypothetical protein
VVLTCGKERDNVTASGQTTIDRKGRSMMAAKSSTDRDAATPSPTEEDQSGETLCEAFTRLTSGNPQFREAKKSGKAFVIVGARPSKPVMG